MESVLVTGVGAPGAYGVIKSLKNKGYNVVGCDVNSDVAGSVLCHEFFEITYPHEDGYIQQILYNCDKYGVNYIIPLVTKELSVLSFHKSDFVNRNITLCAADYKTIKLLNNKCHFLKHLFDKDIQKDEYYVATDAMGLAKAIELLGYPKNKVVIKPSNGNGSRGVRILDDNLDEYELLMNYKPNSIFTTKEEYFRIINNNQLPDLIVTNFYEGIEVTVDTVFLNGELRVMTTRTRDTIKSGISTSGTFINSPQINKKINMIAESIKDLNGVIGFQLKQDTNGEFKFIECNPRIQGTSIAALGLGINYPLLHLESFKEKQLSLSTPSNNHNTKYYRVYKEIYQS